MKRTYSISEVAESIGVSQGTVRNWEKELVDYMAIERDENGCRVYTEELVSRLEKVNQLRAQGLSLAMIREVFSTFYQVAVTDQEDVDVDAPAVNMEAISSAFALQLEELAKRQAQEMKDYIDERLRTVSYIQSEILSQMQQSRPTRMKQRSVFSRVFSL